MLKQQTAFRYLHADMPFFKKTAEAAGYEVLVQSAENDAQAQVSQAENVITQGVDAIVIKPVDFNVAAQIAEMANAAHIPIASYNDLIPGANQTAFIGRDAKEGGQIAAKAILAKVPKGNYALIGGDPGQTGATDMQDGYHDVIDPLVAKGDITIVHGPVHAGWKTEPAQAFAENALTQTNNDVDAFLVSYDGKSLGVMQAIEGAGLKAGLDPGHRPGHGACPPRRRSSRAGMDGSVWPAPDEMGDRGRSRSRWRWRKCKPLRRPTPSTTASAICPGSRRRSTCRCQVDDRRVRLRARLLAVGRRGLQERARTRSRPAEALARPAVAGRPAPWRTGAQSSSTSAR